MFRIIWNIHQAVSKTFYSGDHIKQGLSLVTLPFGWKDWWHRLELSYLYQALAISIFSSATGFHSDLDQKHSIFCFLSSLSGQHKLIPFSVPVLWYQYFEAGWMCCKKVPAGRVFITWVLLTLQNLIFTLTHTNFGSRTGSIQSNSWFCSLLIRRHLCMAHYWEDF